MHQVSGLLALVKSTILAIVVTLGLCSCSTYNPLEDVALYPVQSSPPSGTAVKVTFLGNTTILISDGRTTLLVDGFFSRPSALKTLFGRIAPNREVVEKELRKAGITKVDAILVGHSHHDHALDAPLVAELTNAVVMGSRSYSFIHNGAGGHRLIVVPCVGGQHKFGKFTVSFRRSEHVGSHSYVQRMVEGQIANPLRMPTHFSGFKCGEVFALHIAHPHGSIGVTTTAGARKGQFNGLTADAVFLGVGLIAKECAWKQDFYWDESINALNPHTVIPVHWDNFTRKLEKGLKPAFVDNIEEAMALVKRKAIGRTVRVMNVGNSVLLENGILR